MIIPIYQIQVLVFIIKHIGQANSHTLRSAQKPLQAESFKMTRVCSQEIQAYDINIQNTSISKVYCRKKKPQYIRIFSIITVRDCTKSRGGLLQAFQRRGTLRQRENIQNVIRFAGFTSLSCLYTPPTRLANGLNGFNQRNSILSFVLIIIFIQNYQKLISLDQTEQKDDINQIKSRFNIPGYEQMISLLFIQNKTGQNHIIDEIKCNILGQNMM